MAYRALGRKTEAKELISSACNMIRREGQSIKAQHSELAMMLGNLGIVCENLGEDDLAERYLRDAVDFARVKPGKSQIDYARTLYNLGSFLIKKDRYDEAESFVRAARDVVRPLGKISPRSR